MSFIKIHNLKPSPAKVQILPAKVKLAYKLTGNIGIQIKIRYYLNEDNNVWFVKSDGTLAKEIKKATRVLNPVPMNVSDELEIVKTAEGEDKDYVFIYVEVTEVASGIKDKEECSIDFI